MPEGPSLWVLDQRDQMVITFAYASGLAQEVWN